MIDVRFVPIADIAALLDHFVGTGEQRLPAWRCDISGFN
jgi:hypothetical protein